MEPCKIAVVTDDGVTISQHFGRAKYYEVVSVEVKKIVGKEQREKPGHHTFADHHHDHTNESSEHTATKHQSMAEVINDCKYVVARGMGNSAYQYMEQSHIIPIVTDIEIIEEAVTAVINTTIINHTEKLH
jgi:predicted Fe-Mo cluster-binding NifX family protein